MLENNAPLPVSHLEFLELCCINEKGFIFEDLINSLKKLKILQPKINNKQNNKERYHNPKTSISFEKLYNYNTVNPDIPNNIEIKTENCFISKEMINYCKQKISNLKKSANQIYNNKLFTKTINKNKTMNENVSILKNSIIDVKQELCRICFLDPLKKDIESIENNLSENLNEKNKEKYLSKIQEKFKNII